MFNEVIINPENQILESYIRQVIKYKRPESPVGYAFQEYPAELSLMEAQEVLRAFHDYTPAHKGDQMNKQKVINIIQEAIQQHKQESNQEQEQQLPQLEAETETETEPDQ